MISWCNFICFTVKCFSSTFQSYPWCKCEDVGVALQERKRVNDWQTDRQRETERECGRWSETECLPQVLLAYFLAPRKIKWIDLMVLASRMRNVEWLLLHLFILCPESLSPCGLFNMVWRWTIHNLCMYMAVVIYHWCRMTLLVIFEVCTWGKMMSAKKKNNNSKRNHIINSQYHFSLFESLGLSQSLD